MGIGLERDYIICLWLVIFIILFIGIFFIRLGGRKGCWGGFVWLGLGLMGLGEGLVGDC